tara:strand:+ start:24974 stop:25618 length:645 start_codon:yes stop_codon:yes gene_type:complete
MSNIHRDKEAPTSLRERNKAKKCLAIFNATRELLISEGYDKTTMDAIAVRAEVGVATVYKYFGTKDGLVMELASGDIEEMLAQVDKIVADPPEDLVDAVIAALSPPFNLKMARSDSSVVRYLMDEMWHGQEGDRRKKTRLALAEFETKIETLLVRFQLQGLLQKSLDAKTAARIIYTMLDYNYICFARGEIVTVEAMEELTSKQVRVLVDGWST